METFAAAVLTISAGVWIGAIVFQSAVVAPAVFVDLDEAAARSFLRTLFPRFFRLGLVCGALMLAALLGFGVFAGWTVHRRVPQVPRLWLLSMGAFTASAVVTLGVLFGAGVFPVNSTTVVPLAGLMIGTMHHVLDAAFKASFSSSLSDGGGG